MSAGNDIYEKNIKPIVYLLYAIDNLLSASEKLSLISYADELRERFIVDHVDTRGSGGSWLKICDVNNLQLLTWEENSKKGSKRYDKRSEQFKSFLKRVLNR